MTDGQRPRLIQLSDHSLRFPAPSQAHPSGLLAVGGDLSAERLVAAYAQGIFPWFGEDDPLLWWSPDPRCVFVTSATRPHRRFARSLRQSRWSLSVDCAFAQVIAACAAPTTGRMGTWLTPAMQKAYATLHQRGHAHSFEVWDGTRLVGGLYGVASGGVFSGESMFSVESGGSKVALYAACRTLASWGMPLLDAQVANAHTLGLGAIQIPRAAFLHALRDLADARTPQDWNAELPVRRATDLAFPPGSGSAPSR